MDDYKSFGSFAPVYIEARRALFDKFDTKLARPACAVFMELASHADSYGGGFCGVQRLAKLTHYSPTTVEHALELLSQLDYIRQQSSVDNFGREKAFWQLSPYAMWISPACIDVALKMWESGAICEDFFTKNSGQLSRNLDESYTTRSLTRETRDFQKNQNNQKNHHHQKTAPEKRDSDELENSPAENPDQHEVPKSGPDQHEVPKQQRKAQTELRPSVPPENVREIDFALCRQPLSDFSAETTANKLATWGCGSRLAQARHLVQQHGWKKVEIGMALVSRMPGVKNPQGLLRKQLNLGLLDKAVDPSSEDYYFNGAERAEGTD